MISQTLYYLGGEYPDGSASRAMWRYDPVLNAWHEMAGMNVCRYKIWIIFLDKKFFLSFRKTQFVVILTKKSLNSY